MTQEELDKLFGERKTLRIVLDNHRPTSIMLYVGDGTSEMSALADLVDFDIITVRPAEFERYFDPYSSFAKIECTLIPKFDLMLTVEGGATKRLEVVGQAMVDDHTVDYLVRPTSREIPKVTKGISLGMHW